MPFIRIVEEYLPIAEESFPALSTPSCEDGVTFTVFQKHVDTGIARKAHARVTGTAHCTSTGEEIPAMAWTDAMERTFESLRARTPVETSTTLSTVGKGLTALLVVLLIAVPAGIWMEASDTSFADHQASLDAVTTAPSVGDYIQTSGGDLADPASIDMMQKQWYRIDDMTDETVVLQPYNETFGTAESDPFAEPDLDPARFSGPTVEVPRAGFLRGGSLIDDPRSSYRISDAVDADA